ITAVGWNNCNVRTITIAKIDFLGLRLENKIHNIIRINGHANRYGLGFKVKNNEGIPITVIAYWTETDFIKLLDSINNNNAPIPIETRTIRESTICGSISFKTERI
ncbi:MAG: hypothetical protein ABEI13_01885, partial [Candidatus Paceibacteria bacterium]